jgi:AcrR family transcriptional regulator
MAVNARRGRPLSAEEIHLAALRIIDAEGVERLSMRKLAAELDVNPMSLYHHVPSKTALLQHVCSMNAKSLLPPPNEGAPWQRQLREIADTYRRIAREHPSLWSYAQLHPELTHREEGLWEAFNDCLRAAGVPKERFAQIRIALFGMVAGYLSAEAAGLLAANDDQVDTEAAFQTAVDLLITGLDGYR